jgi:hypothetical protein
MTTPAIVGLSLLVAAMIFVLLATLMLGLRAARIGKRASAIRQHPTLLALRQFDEQATKLNSALSQLPALGGRFAAIAHSVVQLSVAAGLLDLNIDRVAFATRLLLRTVRAAAEFTRR